MAELKELRTRIEAIKSTQKITSAMKMISAARLRKVQLLVDKNQGYSENLRRSALRVFSEIIEEEKEKNIRFMRPIFIREAENPQNYLLYVLSSDRGLCGAYNSNIAKKAAKRIRELLQSGKKIEVICIGKKAYDYLNRRFPEPNIQITRMSDDIKSSSYTDLAAQIAYTLIYRFGKNEFDVCEFVYARFISAINRSFECQQLCPIELNTEHISDDELKHLIYAKDAQYEYLPNKLTVLTDILPILFNDSVFKVIVNSAASEHSARMSSMDNATRNAKKMISELTLKYNSLRQSAITTELIEIIAGAEAI